MADLVTLPELLAALNMDEPADTTELELYISAVTAHVADIYGAFPTASRTEVTQAYVDSDGVVRVLLASQPVSAITSLTHHDGRVLSSGFTITADGYVEHDELTAGRWTVVYESGYATVPADLKLAALEDIRGLYQPGQIGPPAQFGAFGIESAEFAPSYRPVRMWPRVDAWLERHTLPGIA